MLQPTQRSKVARSAGRRVLLSALPALAMALCGGTASSAPHDPDLHPAPGKFIWLGNYRLHVHCLGKGSPTVIFDSGLGGTSLDWAKVQPKVARSTRACVYDRAGYGWSDRGPEPRDSQAIVRELEALLGYGTIKPPYILVGHSFGGFNIRLFARNFPHRVAGMVLVDSSHEDQFEMFDRAGLTPIDPRGRSFFVSNQFQIPADLPDDLKPVARSFAISADSITALYSELANMRASARQVGVSRTLPDVPLVVVHHNPGQDGQDSEGLRKAAIWQQMQQELGTRTSRADIIVAKTSDHHIQLAEPETVVSAITQVIRATREDIRRASN